MTKQEAKEHGFTHKGFIYSFIKVYVKDFDSFEPQLVGINYIYDSLLLIFGSIDEMLGISDSFYIENLEEI